MAGTAKKTKADARILQSRAYWDEREEENRKLIIQDEKKRAEGIRDILLKAAEAIKKEIEAFYGQYATREGITLADAKARVSALDIKTYSQKAKKYVKERTFTKQANEEMRIYNLTMKINRLEMLKANIGLELCSAYSEVEEYFGASLSETARKEFRRQAGILGGTVDHMERHVKQILDGSFHNAHFSERLWTNQAYLKMQLDGLLRTGLIQGRNPRELARQLRKHVDASCYDAERLMRTEMCRVQIGTQLESYKANDYGKLVIIPEHDARSCDYCEEQDGVVVEVAKAVPGVNVPPFHPNCRCSTAAWVEEVPETIKARIEGNGDPFVNDTSRTEKELEMMASEIREEIKKFSRLPSKWSGRVKVLQEMDIPGAAAYTNRNSDIVGLSSMTDYTLWHEMLHTASASHYSMQVCADNRGIEESSVEFLTREICKEKGIATGNAYEQGVEILSTISSFLGFDTKKQFALELFNCPLPDRFDWLEETFSVKMIQEGLSVEQQEEGMMFIRGILEVGNGE